MQRNPQRGQFRTNPPVTGKKALAKMAQAAGVALVATPGTCHKWLTSAGCSSTTCRFKHPPAHKGRADLLPLCQEAVSAGGACPRLAVGQKCTYRHDGIRWHCPYIALMGVPVQPQVSQGAVEMALIAMMQQQKDFQAQAQEQVKRKRRQQLP